MNTLDLIIHQNHQAYLAQKASLHRVRNFKNRKIENIPITSYDTYQEYI